ncbi:Chaperone protein EcpD precursor [compost metagenome]
MLEAHNPSHFYVNLSELSVHVDGRQYPVISSHIAPLSAQLFAVKGLMSVQAAMAAVHFASVNDYGTVLPARTPAEVVPRH